MSAATLSRQRCWVHPVREAAARCPVCTRFFCRECVTEHGGRVICAGCLRAAAARDDRAGSGGTAATWRWLLAAGTRAGQLAASVVVAWIFFQLLGDWLLRTATEFHQSKLWKQQLSASGFDTDEDTDEGGENSAGKPADGGRSTGRGELTGKFHRAAGPARTPDPRRQR